VEVDDEDEDEDDTSGSRETVGPDSGASGGEAGVSVGKAGPPDDDDDDDSKDERKAGAAGDDAWKGGEAVPRRPA
jgi:hypothetical protein